MTWAGNAVRALLAARGNNIILCFAMTYKEVFSWEPFRIRDRSIAFLSRIIYNKTGQKEAIRMANGYAKEIQNRIGAAPDGTIFIVPILRM